MVFIDCNLQIFILTWRLSIKFLHINERSNSSDNQSFRVLRKCQGKFDCLVFEMLYIKNLKSNFSIQTDSISAKLFV